ERGCRVLRLDDVREVIAGALEVLLEVQRDVELLQVRKGRRDAWRPGRCGRELRDRRNGEVRVVQDVKGLGRRGDGACRVHRLDLHPESDDPDVLREVVAVVLHLLQYQAAGRRLGAAAIGQAAEAPLG